MGKSAAKVKSTTSDTDDVQQKLADFEPKSQFLDLALNMSWQLAIAVILPIYAAVRIDAHFKSAPSVTIVGFFFAIMLAAMIVKRTLIDVNNASLPVNKKKDSKKK
jgi:hypothetical protein